MESNLKRIRFENDGVDRISELPDSILCKILSFLPTKNAIGVKILSTRWKNLYPFVFLPITLELHDSVLLNPRQNNLDGTSFVDFVDKVLNQTLSDVPYVEKVILKCDKNYGDAKVASWVCAAVRFNVRHLDLEFSRNESTTLFHSLNGCTTLLTLRLSLECGSPECELRVPDNFSLPNLKSLDLAKLTLDIEVTDPIEQLVQGCPGLEYLSLVQCNAKGCYDVHIESPLLKKLVITNCWEELCHLVVNAPNLEVLINNNFLADNYHVCNFNSLQMAHIDVAPNQQLVDILHELGDEDDPLYFDNAATIVSRCSSTIHLHLSHRAIDALNQATMPLPVFQNLIRLSLGCLQWALLARLLSIAPNLEQLIMEEGFQKNEGGFSDFKYLMPLPPECLVLHVKSIEFSLFRGDEDEMKLVEYFLKNGEVLQNLKLHCVPSVDKSILTRLLILPRQSRTCQIECTR